jgi:hypothetical protein
LAKSEELAEVVVVHPSASDDDLVAEVREMGDGSSEGRQSELQERDENFAYAALSLTAVQRCIRVRVQMPST